MNRRLDLLCQVTPLQPNHSAAKPRQNDSALPITPLLNSYSEGIKLRSTIIVPDCRVQTIKLTGAVTQRDNYVVQDRSCYSSYGVKLTITTIGRTMMAGTISDPATVIIDVKDNFPVDRLFHNFVTMELDPSTVDNQDNHIVKQRWITEITRAVAICIIGAVNII
ncbi:hypothetical protein J6590_046143 [Homalodisca vitripennis]|nr:hypothetical protein J6590_046143 [Homalodisca vitripennis]